MEKVTINITMPRTWQELSQEQLSFVYSLLALGKSFYEVRTHCLLRWNRIGVVARDGEWFVIVYNKNVYRLKAIQIFELVARGYEWPDLPPGTPLRLSHIPLSWWQKIVFSLFHPLRRGRTSKTLPPDFRGVELEKFLFCDNLYQGYLYTKDDTILDSITETLYPGTKTDKLNLSSLGMSRVNTFYWFASLKNLFSRTFDEFIRPVEEGETAPSTPSAFGSKLQRNMDAQIRALTKGDITKESTILSLDTWRAFTELNAQAKEYRELKEKTSKN